MLGGVRATTYILWQQGGREDDKEPPGQQAATRQSDSQVGQEREKRGIHVLGTLLLQPMTCTFQSYDAA